MAGSAAFFSRVLADIFPGKATEPNPTSTPTPSATQPHTPSSAKPVAPAGAPAADVVPRVIGQGAANETLVTIADEPNLFVEEAYCVVQFKPAFDEHANETPFGLKILPDLAPHWSQAHIHRCSLKEAIATAIRSVGQAKPIVPPVSAVPQAAAQKPREPLPTRDENVTSNVAARRAPRREPAHDAAAVECRVVSWGEERFPDRKKPGRFYPSFAMHIDTVSGERTLQGEGLKEAIAESGCHVGDYIAVRRLGKIQVPAIRHDGSPKLINGQQVMWDKWLWSITK